MNSSRKFHKRVEKKKKKEKLRRRRAGFQPNPNVALKKVYLAYFECVVYNLTSFNMKILIYIFPILMDLNVFGECPDHEPIVNLKHSVLVELAF